MNLKYLSREHLYGLLLGLLTIVVFVPILLWVFDLFNNTQYWYLDRVKSKIISLATIANLGWFHWFIKKNKIDLAKGILAATFISFFVIVYFKVIL